MIIRIKITAFLATVGLGIIGSAFAADLAVLESNSVRYTAGDIIDGDLGVSLSQNETLLVAAEDGSIFDLQGPFEGVPKGTATSQLNTKAALRRLLGTDTTRTIGLGAVRGGEVAAAGMPQDTRPNPWYFHIGHPGPQCFAEGSKLALWREKTDEPVDLQVQRLSTGEGVDLNWPAGSNSIDWPATLDVTDGEIYLVRPGDQIRSLQIITVQLPAGTLSTDEAAVAWLAAKGCDRQAEILARDL